MKRNRSEILQWALLLLLTAQLLYGIFGKSDSALEHTLKHIQSEVSLVSDSLQTVYKRLQKADKSFRANQIELAILRKERRLLSLEKEKEQSRNRKELKALQVALEAEKVLYQKLIEKARQFEK